jgi:hypothetical protein
MELKPFGIDFVPAQPGNLLTGGLGKTAAQLKHISANMTAEQRSHYDKSFTTFASAFNRMQEAGMAADAAAARVIKISEQIPAPTSVPVGKDA